MTELRIESGVPPRELEEWFMSQAHSRQGNRYYGEGWQVTLRFQPSRRMGALLLPVTILVFAGELAETMANKYRLQFLSAGG